MTRAAESDSGSASAWGRSHRARVRAALAGVLALALAGSAVAAASPAHADGGHVIRGTVPNVYGAAGAGAVITVECSGTPVESVSAPALPDGTWQLEVLSPVGTECALAVVASPLGGTYRFVSSFAVGVTDKVVAVEYPPVTTLDVVTSPGAVGPTGTAHTSSEGSFTFADGTRGYLTTSLSWDPSQGPVSYARADVTFFSFDVPLADGYHVKDPRYVSSAPGSLTITAPRTWLVTASGEVVNATVTTTGRVVLGCWNDVAIAAIGLTYTVSVRTDVDATCSVNFNASDGDGTSETIGRRPVEVLEGVAYADLAVSPLRTIAVLEASGAPATGATLTWVGETSVDLPDGAVLSIETNGQAPLSGAPVTVPVPDQEGGLQFKVRFDDGSQHQTSSLAVGSASSLTITLPPRVTYTVAGSVLEAAGMAGTASLNCGGSERSVAVQQDSRFDLAVVGFGVWGCLLTVRLVDESATGIANYEITRGPTMGAVIDGAATATVELAVPEPITLHALTPLGAPVDLTGEMSAYTSVASMPDGGVASVSAYHQGIQFTGGLVALRLPTSGYGYHVLSDNGSYSSSGPFALPATSEATFVASGPPGRWYPVGPTTSTDNDGVPDAVEGGAPNDGDGNSDGLLDSQQPEVTSLPAADGSYLTLVSGDGTTFGPVSTQDGSALPPPPAGVTLPSGLVGFRVDGLTPGGTATVRVYSGSLDGVTGWAKFHDGAWFTLPAADVSVHPAYVEIRITDGGPFDDDGAADGSVLDPGGPAVLADQDPPVVSCASAPSAWSATDVTIACTSSDAGTGLADSADASFALSTSVPVGTETSAAATGSREVCDVAGNCATARPVTGIKVDRRGPQIAITGPADGAQITQGSTVLAAYACTDAGSGPATCVGGVAAGQALPTSTPGATTLTVNATDAAGNTSTRTVSYTVVAANAAPVVAADMGVTGLETIASQSGLLALTARFTDADGNGPFTASVQWAPGSAFKPATVTGPTVTASATYLSGGSRAVVVKVCDAAGACGTDTVTVRTYVRDRVAPVAQCLVDRGSAASPRYLARFGYTSSASVPLWIPVVPGLENTFLRDPARRGQPTVFLPGKRTGVLDVAFASGDVSWRLNGSTATVSSRTRRC